MNISLAILTIFTMMQLNCENLFDCNDDSLKQDEDFLPTAVRRWTPNRYREKLNNVSRAVIAAGECNPDKGGEVVPDIVTFCEVENDTVMSDLTKRSILRTVGYEYLMTSSPDVRGIDVALMYQPTSFFPVACYSIGVKLPIGKRPTRDILYVKGLTTGRRDSLHVFVVHAPSRYGGVKHSNPNRMAVAERLCQSIDSIRHIDADANIVVSGDFNDYHDSESLTAIYNHKMTNVTAEAKGKNGAEATYYYKNEWNSIDHIIVSSNIADSVVSAYVNDPMFLLEYDEKQGIVRPRRTYRGMKHQRGGCSDHLPLVVRLKLR